MRVLITNMVFTRSSGSEVAAEHTADGLRRAGHEVVLYAPMLGDHADQMRKRGHVVLDRLDAMPFRPDVIHAQHATPAIMAMTAYPDTPVVHVCHSARFAQEAPLLHPQVRRYVAVDELCRARCLADGVPAERLSVLLNPVDLERFRPRQPLPARPRKALLLTKTPEQREAVATACRLHEIELDELGPASGRVSLRLEEELGGYDVVFATARMALEAAAVGCAVVVADGRGFAGLLTSERLPEWRRHNFGAALLSHAVTGEALDEALSQYDAADSASVSAQIRQMAALPAYVDQLLGVYREAIADGSRIEAEAHRLASARLLEDWLPTPAARPWRQMVMEKRWVSLADDDLREMEDRLTRDSDKQRSRLKRQMAQIAQELGDELGVQRRLLERLVASLDAPSDDSVVADRRVS